MKIETNKASTCTCVTNQEKTIKNKHCHQGKYSDSFLDKNIVLNELRIYPGQVILDAGCGNGYMAKSFARLLRESGRVYALDPDELSINKLKKETKNTIIDAFVGDITRETKIDKSSVDLVYISTVMHGFLGHQMEGFIKEAKRILKPDGELAVLEIIKETTPFGPPMEVRLSPDELIQKLQLTPKKTIKIGENFYLQTFRY